MLYAISQTSVARKLKISGLLPSLGMKSGLDLSALSIFSLPARMFHAQLSALFSSVSITLHGVF